MSKPKNIDLANKCGSCCHFEPIEGACSGYCLRNKYGENVVHNPEHPYWQVQRSRLKCVDYNKKPQTNADHIRSMTDEELAEYLYDRVGIAAEHIAYCEKNPECELMLESDICIPDAMCKECLCRWLKQSYGGDT